MQSFRSSLLKSRALSNTVYNNSIIQQVNAKRTVVLASGQRVRGAIRNPDDILISKGYKYGENEENLKIIKNYLKSKLNDKYELPDNLLLQILTHKSFAHGSKPYNEKLSFIGKELLKFNISKYIINLESDYDFAINKKNFEGLGSFSHKMTSSDKLLFNYIKSNNLNEIFFCKTAKNQKEDQPSTIYSTIITSLIGAIASKSGKSAAEEFIQTEILPNILPKVEELRQSTVKNV
ncbi:hypothetical protein BVG19_g2915 [[Candida] boidinii]|nr:hypothetical protein BVG19_g2915 [[Candida] boidinii]OWB52024.1 hypothetical protein B5S27_g3595 [[Candida] boidinii]OWB66494.1 hypothetical protein B5S30_g1835 [[Candida] boidinii]OWB81700.1 hypothetical protein B5S33_g319 [[Candida] boidinii]